MILSDKTIKEYMQKGKIVVNPTEDRFIQPSSVDLRLLNEFRVFKHEHESLIDIDNPKEHTEKVLVENRNFILHPGDFVLGSTVEHIEVPNDLVARIEGKSSLGRIGLLAHATAGYIDPGFKGKITLELKNVGKLPIALKPGMKIAQLSFIQMTTECERPYGSKELQSKYNNQSTVEEAKLHNLK